MKLYELPAAYERLADLLVGEDGEVSPEAEAALASLEGEFADRVDGVCKLIARFFSNAAAAHNEIERLALLEAQNSNAGNRLKAFLKACLEQMRMTKFETALFKVRLQKNPVSIIWTKSIDELPRELRRTVVEFSKSAARNLIDAGVPLPDGVKVEQGTHLRIS